MKIVSTKDVDLLSRLIKTASKCGSLYSNRFFVYIIQLEDGSIYVGKSSIITSRIIQHILGMTSKTRRIYPKRMIALYEYDSNIDAVKAEINIMKEINPSQYASERGIGKKKIIHKPIGFLRYSKVKRKKIKPRIIKMS